MTFEVFLCSAEEEGALLAAVCFIEGFECSDTWQRSVKASAT